MRRALLICLAVPLLVGGATTAGGAANPVNGRIAFERSGFFGGTEVWTMNQDGTDLRRVAAGGDPAWSPDGTRLVLSDPDGRLVVVPTGGGEPHRLDVIGGPIGGVHPAWSPDGSSIAFGASDGVYVVPVAGGRASRLVVTSVPAPAWSPDGTQISFIDTNGAVKVMSADGSGLRNVPGATAEGGGGQRVSWSPDGSTIAFGDAQSARIATVRLNGAPPRILLPSGVVRSGDPAWSPDGRRIAFADGGDICVADTDSARLVRLTYGADADASGHSGRSTNSHPAWQPRLEGSTPAGELGAPLGPAPDWDRTLSWNWSCSLVHRGRALSGTASPGRAKVGNLVTFTVRLANTTAVPIGETGFAAFYADLDGGAHVVSAATTRGPCRTSPIGGSNAPAIGVECKFGSVFGREAVTATIRVRPLAPGELTLVTSLPKPLPAGDGTDASDPDLVQRVPVAGCTLRGTRQADVLNGSSRADVLCGLDANDRIRGRAGRDAIYAGAGDDVVFVRDGEQDRVSCGRGQDTALADRRDRVDRDCEQVRR